MDFTIKIYQQLLQSLQSAGFSFLTFSDFLTRSLSLPGRQTGGVEMPSSADKIIILRHDVDLLPHHSLRFAQIQNAMGIKGSYYFRAVPESWNEEVIKEIAQLGHEVGYHYETMDTAKGDVDLAFVQFKDNLEKLKKLVPVSTICMHGSPRSKFDNKDIWNKYDYKELGIIGEPYYDMNFDEFFYLTDTGRRWDGWKTSVRDKVPQQDQWLGEGLVFHSTSDIINAANNQKLPSKIMFTFHPQRWNSNPYLWTKELIMQNAKNQVKRFLVKK